MPFEIIFSLPFYLIAESLIGFYDQRFISILAVVVSLGLILKLLNFQEKKLVFPILIFLNPLFTTFLIWGINDIFILTLLILVFYLLQNKKIKESSFVLGLVCATKQPAWFFAPFFFGHIYLKKRGGSKEKIKSIIKETWPFLILVVIVLPFLFWDFGAFFEDTFLYLTGKSDFAYPISGYGFSMILLNLDFIKDRLQYFPFMIIQLAVCLPLFFYLIKIQRENNSIRQVFLNSVILLSTFLYFSRFLNGSYIAFLFVLFVAAYLFNNRNRLWKRH